MKSTRDRENTRQEILDIAALEFWSSGYNATRVDTIVEKTNFTKGAFYHHFPSKKALVLAVLEESVGTLLRERWVAPFENCDHPLDTLLDRLRELKGESTEEGIRFGCPLNNLAQELSGTDEDIRIATMHLFQEWIHSIAGALRQSQNQGVLRQGLNPLQLATYIVAAFEGGISLAKTERSPESLDAILDGLVAYLEGLRIS